MNCIIIEDDLLSSKLIEEFIKKTSYLKFIKSFSGAVDAINFLNANNNIDLIFLDIEMPEMTGIDFMNSLENPPLIIVVSAKEKYAINAFEHNVIDYLLKPLIYSRFLKSIQRAITRFVNTRGIAAKNEEIFIKKGSSLVKFKFDDILWVEALENYVIFNTFSDKYTVHLTMKSLDKKMPQNKFIRVHRSYIVNINKIDSIEDNSVIITIDNGNKVIPIGKSFREVLFENINLIK